MVSQRCSFQIMLSASWDLNSPHLSTKSKLNGDVFSLLRPGGGGGGGLLGKNGTNHENMS